MRLRTRLALPLVALALVGAGCGGSDSKGGGGGSDDPAQAFTSACGQCHTLSAADTNGSFGPNLDELKPSSSTVLDAIRNGPGPMPDNLLQGKQAQAVADYVAKSAGS